MNMKQYIRFIIFLITPLTCVMCTGKTDRFLSALQEDRASCSDSVRIAIVDKSDIYGESSSSASDYVPLFNYLIEHSDKRNDGNIGCNLYRMFSGFPSKQSEFDGYLALLPPDEQKAAITTLTTLLIEAFVQEPEIEGISDYTTLKSLFVGKFPFINKLEESQESSTAQLATIMKEHRKKIFLEALREDRIACSDSLRTEIVVISPIYEEISSAEPDYVPLFNYLTGHCTEEYAEGIGYSLYKMFSEFPSKQSEFEGFLELLPPDEQKVVITTLTLFLFFEFRYEYYIEGVEIKSLADMKICKRKFFEKFPFLNGYKASIEYVESSLKEPYP